jgi:hypothetical protein
MAYSVKYSFKKKSNKSFVKLFCSLLFCAIVINSIPAYSQSCKITIQIEILPELKKIFENTVIDVKLLGDNFVSKTAVIKYGKAVITFDSVKSEKFTIMVSSFINKPSFEKDYSTQAIINRTINDTSFFVRLSFPENCVYNLVGMNKICPKCHKKDKVIPILYGLRVPSFDKKHNRIHEPEYLPGVCSVTKCDPSWYCKRNKLKF